MNGQPGLWNRFAQAFASAALIVTVLVCTLWLSASLPDGVVAGTALVYVALAIVLLGYVPVVVAHELGHVLAAALAGWQVPVISIYGLTLWLAPLRLRFGARVFGGAGIIAVPPRARPLRLGYCLVMTGGALGNFALAAAALLLAPRGAPAVHGIFVVVAALSCAIGALNLLPYVTRRGSTTDGLKVFEALRGKSLDAYANETRLYEQVVRCIAPRAWDPAVVAAVEVDARAGVSSWSGDLMLYSRALAERRFDDARAALARAAAKRGDADVLAVERAFLAAFADRDAAAAGGILARLDRSRVQRLSTYWRTLGLVRQLSGNRAAAGEAFRRARRMLRRMPFTTRADYEGIDVLETIEPAAKPA